jgi:DNA invertase Pin-like site-specific DNA recombinase
MSANDKIKAMHLKRCAIVYVRQSTAAQVQYNRESTDRQYKLSERALKLGWSDSQIKIVDEDLARSGAGTSERNGFVAMTTEIALGHVGLILSIEVSRVARNNADWYRLLDLCGVTDTLIGDEDGIYHPGLFNDRLLLGLKGTMAEAELHVIRARLEGGIRNKAARGELRRGLPVGFIWGEDDGEVLIHPDQSVAHAIQCIFEKFAEVGSVRQVWLWFRSQNISFPSQSNSSADIRWITATYTGIHHVLTNPVYAGAYTYGKTHQERFVDQDGRLRKLTRTLPRSEWAVLIQDHHKGFIDWETYEMNQSRIAKNNRHAPHQASGAIREGSALLQGLATCGRCGRRLLVYYQGNNSTPGYYCAASNIANGRGLHCMRVGGVRIDEAVAQAFLEAVAPVGIEAALLAEKNIAAEHDAAIAQWRLQVERARYETERAERRYRAVEPENRLVIRTLETEWERRLNELAAAEAELTRRQYKHPKSLTEEQRTRIGALGADLKRVWEASTTTDRDRKELIQTLLDEVCITLEPAESIAGILNRQDRKTVHNDSFTANKVGNLRRYWKIPRFEPGAVPVEGELVTITKAAEILQMAPSTIHRWLSDGFIAGEQVTPGAPWQIRISDEIRSRFVEQAPEGYVPMIEATKLLGVSRQTVLQRVKRGDVTAVHVRSGRRSGLYIKTLGIQQGLFDNLS